MILKLQVTHEALDCCTVQLPMSHLMCNKAVWPVVAGTDVAHMLPLQKLVQHVMIVNQ
jgi:hypothetical protein